MGCKVSQIKLRGQRIEPGKIEYQIGQLPGVEHSMVAKPEYGLYAGQLVAAVQMRMNQNCLPVGFQTPISIFYRS